MSIWKVGSRGTLISAIYMEPYKLQSPLTKKNFGVLQVLFEVSSTGLMRVKCNQLMTFARVRGIVRGNMHTKWREGAHQGGCAHWWLGCSLWLPPAVALEICRWWQSPAHTTNTLSTHHLHQNLTMDDWLRAADHNPLDSYISTEFTLIQNIELYRHCIFTYQPYRGLQFSYFVAEFYRWEV